MGKMYKKNPQVALPGVSALLSMRGAHPPCPTIQDGTGLWDGADRLNPSKALVLSIYPSATTIQPIGPGIAQIVSNIFISSFLFCTLIIAHISGFVKSF